MYLKLDFLNKKTQFTEMSNWKGAEQTLTFRRVRKEEK